MGHEQDSGAGLAGDPQQLGLHALAGHLVERAEGLVHEQQLGAGRERPGDRDALLHPAGQFARAGRGELGEPDQLQQLGGARPALRLRDAVDVQRQLDVLRDRAPLQEPGLLERDAVVLVEAGLPGRFAADERRARGGLLQVGDQPQQRRLPAPGRPDERDELARADGQVDAGERVHVAEPLLDAGEGDGGCHARCPR
ncbi:hypothetical protein BJF78_09070 [Pseudonocardia sp. CNS-139]|nr:hypothetical protein BJF78_09070 [Pseudonocardia sp. CNS-139]